MRREDIIYQQEFGNIPDNQLDRISYILGTKVNDIKYNQNIEKMVKRIKRIKFKTVDFTMWKIVKPAARPRANRRGGYIRMYVPGAAQAGDWFSDFCKENDLPFIETPCILNMEIYQKTPSSFSKAKKVLCELGVIRPWTRTGDFDNYAKTVADSIQHGMLKDDCLIYSSKIDRYYSIKPHAIVSIKYMEKFPEV